MLIVGIFRSLIRSSVTAVNPYNYYICTLIEHGFNNRLVKRLYEMTILSQLLEYAVNAVLWNSLDRKSGRTVFFLNSDNNVAAANIINIIGKCADSPYYRLRIKSFLVFDSCRFNCALSD